MLDLRICPSFLNINEVITDVVSYFSFLENRRLNESCVFFCCSPSIYFLIHNQTLFPAQMNQLCLTIFYICFVYSILFLSSLHLSLHIYPYIFSVYYIFQYLIYLKCKIFTVSQRNKRHRSPRGKSKRNAIMEIW